MYTKRLQSVVIIILLSILFLMFQNFTTPNFPSRNVDTVVVKKNSTSGKLESLSNHLPAVDFSLDGRIALRRKQEAGSGVPFYIIKPENVKGHFKSSENALTGGGLLEGAPDHIFYPKLNYKNLPKLNNFNPGRSFLCEKTEIKNSPYICDGDKDCYNITLVTMYKDERVSPIKIRLVSTDLIIRVKDPKTTEAKIDSFSIVSGSRNIGGVLDTFPKMAEPVIVGDNRLFITRVQKSTVTLSDGTATEGNINIVYSNYKVYEGDEVTEQCDVTKWSEFHPISHAHYDSVHSMKSRYKFAKYPLRDTLGNAIDNGKELGGSYPWMDKGAVNLFFTAYGLDLFYNFDSSGKVTIPFIESEATDYFSPETTEEANYVEARVGKTAGISMAGFWTQGKMVLFDGQLNNADYNFTISDRIDTRGDRIETLRKLNLYNFAPTGQIFESVGAVRERGDAIIKDDYHTNLTPNSTFLGSIENRFNYLDKMKPGLAKDVVWYFGSTRHTEELAFDDYISPYFLINADMTGAVAYLKNGARMKHYSGFKNGVAQSFSDSGFVTQPASSPVLIQNASTTVPEFMKVPGYGKPVGDVRLEPIAKGGIYGKGLWLNGKTGLSFEVPGQSSTSFDLEENKNWFMSVFVDARRVETTVSQEKLLFSNSRGRSVLLVKSNSTGSHIYDSVILKKGTSKIGTFSLPSGLEFKHKVWKHIAIQFISGENPLVYIDGFYAGSFKPDGSSKTERTSNYRKIKKFFKVLSGDVISLGATDITAKNGVKGWFDEFKLIARAPMLEEVCNYSRGTLIKLNAEKNVGWLAVAKKYPKKEHAQLRAILGESVTSQRYACFRKYYDGVNIGKKITGQGYAQLRNIPRYSVSIREKALGIHKKLVFDSPRPDLSSNNFCLSCHVPVSQNANDEFNVNALLPLAVDMQNDSRRQPLQSDKFFRGVVPANYFGPGAPSSTLTNKDAHYIDKWLHPAD